MIYKTIDVEVEKTIDVEIDINDITDFISNASEAEVKVILKQLDGYIPKTYSDILDRFDWEVLRKHSAPPKQYNELGFVIHKLLLNSNQL